MRTKVQEYIIVHYSSMQRFFFNSLIVINIIIKQL